MTVEIVIKNGREYFRWGNSGKVYPTKEKALRQGRIIKRRKKNGS